MASCSGVDLADRDTGCGDTPGIVIGLLVTFDNCEAEFMGQFAQGTLQQGSFAGAGRADQVKNKNPFILEQGAVKTCQTVVFAKDIFFDGNY
jgi:hypothetical protein